jgi:hypothetical protein
MEDKKERDTKEQDRKGTIVKDSARSEDHESNKKRRLNEQEGKPDKFCPGSFHGFR